MRVVRALSALGDVVLRDDVGVEEVAGAVGAVRHQVGLVVGGDGLAGGGALTRVKGASEEVHGDVGVVVCLDGAAELGGAGEVGV